jgi:hypothetical protein
MLEYHTPWGELSSGDKVMDFGREHGKKLWPQMPKKKLNVATSHKSGMLKRDQILSVIKFS